MDVYFDCSIGFGAAKENYIANANTSTSSKQCTVMSIAQFEYYLTLNFDSFNNEIIADGNICGPLRCFCCSKAYSRTGITDLVNVYCKFILKKQ